MAGQLPPALPPLNGELTLAVFSHKSLAQQQPGQIDTATEYGSQGRLCILGAHLLTSAVTVALFSKKPMLNEFDLEKDREESLRPASIQKWVSDYNLRAKVICTPDWKTELAKDNETCTLFYSYVGAVYTQYGMTGVLNWIGALVNPGGQPLGGGPGSSPMMPASPPASPRQAPSGAPPIFTAGLAGATGGYLALFNQLASQRRKVVDWQAESVGPSHSPTWTIRATSDGHILGEAVNTNKKDAKEEAARMALMNLGWASV